MVKTSPEKTSKRIDKISHKTTKNMPSLRNIGILFASIQLIAFIAFIVTITKLNLLHEWQLVIVSFFAVAAQIFTFSKALSSRSKKGVKIFAIILSAILSLVFFIGQNYSRKTIDLIQSATGVHYETQNYSVLVLKTSGYNEISQLRNQNIGYLTSNPNFEDTRTTLHNVINHHVQSYDDLASMISSIYAFQTSAIVLNDNYLEYIEESDSEFINESKIIYTFEVRKEAEDKPAQVDVKTEPFAIYLSGSDSRGTISDTARSDVNIVIVVRPQDGKILLVNIPRDYYVQLHGTTGTRDKLTHAGVYGIDMSRKTIEDLLGIEINYTAKVGFNTVIKVVDALGGIDIDSDQEFTAHTNKTCHFKYGVQHVDSTCALAFSRERYAYATGDRHRGENQQAVITAIIEKLSNPKYMLKYTDIINAAQGSFETNLSYDEITNFAKQQLSSLKNWEVESIALDGSGAMMPTYSMGARKLYVIIQNQSTISSDQAKIKEYLAK